MDAMFLDDERDRAAFMFVSACCDCTILQDAMKMLALVDRCCDVTGYQIRPGLVCSSCGPTWLPGCRLLLRCLILTC